jgi:hypothetical protein
METFRFRSLAGRPGATAGLLAAAVLMLAAGPAAAKHPNSPDTAAGGPARSVKASGGADAPRGKSKTARARQTRAGSKADNDGGGNGQVKAKARGAKDTGGSGKSSSASGQGTTGTGPKASTTKPVAPPVTTTLPAVAAPAVSAAPARTAAPAQGGNRRQTSSGARQVGGARRGGAATAAPLAAAAGPLLSPAPHAARLRAATHERLAAPRRNPLSSVGRSIPLPLPVPDWSKPVIVALLALALFFAMRSRLTLLRARRLERQRQQLLADVGLLQAALLPEIPERVGDLSASVAYRPANGPGAGGDFYDVFTFGQERVAIIVGDVSGHGREALARATLMRYTLRAYAEARLEPREALDLAEHVLGTDGHGGSEVNGDFTTVAMAVYDPAAATLTYALAGHPPPVLIGAPICEPEGAGYTPPIGWGMRTGQRQTTVTLPAGAVACFFTDGLVEARADGRPFGRERLADELKAGGATISAGALLDHLVAEADATPDDMAACVVHTHREAPGAAVRVEELVVAPDEVDGPGTRRFLTACGVRAREVALALDSTRRIAREYDGAVVYVRIDAAGASVKVTGVRSEPVDGRPLRVVEPASSLAS